MIECVKIKHNFIKLERGLSDIYIRFSCGDRPYIFRVKPRRISIECGLNRFCGLPVRDSLEEYITRIRTYSAIGEVLL